MGGRGFVRLACVRGCVDEVGMWTWYNPWRSLAVAIMDDVSGGGRGWHMHALSF